MKGTWSWIVRRASFKQWHLTSSTLSALAFLATAILAMQKQSVNLYLPKYNQTLYVVKQRAGSQEPVLFLMVR